MIDATYLGHAYVFKFFIDRGFGMNTVFDNQRTTIE
jgi:hypothetical protein